jgi:hypothetical protein
MADEIAISDRREAELAKNGFMPLVHRKNSTSPCSSARNRCKSRRNITIPTPCQRQPFGSAAVYVRMLSICALPEHRPRQGRQLQEREDMEKWLNGWIELRGCDPKNSSRNKARRPLAAAEVTVEEVEGNPGVHIKFSCGSLANQGLTVRCVHRRCLRQEGSGGRGRVSAIGTDVRVGTKRRVPRQREMIHGNFYSRRLTVPMAVGEQQAQELIDVESFPGARISRLRCTSEAAGAAGEFSRSHHGSNVDKSYPAMLVNCSSGHRKSGRGAKAGGEGSKFKITLEDVRS